MNNGEEGSEGDSKRVQVRFVTKLDAPFKVPPTVIAIPAALSRFGLSSVVNGLLQAADADHEAEPFDFWIDGELVRMSLQQFLLAKGISAERILKIEYARVVAPQKVEEPSFCDDRVGAVDGSSSRFFLTGYYDHLGRVWRSAGLCTHILEGHKEAVTSVCVINPEGVETVTLATASHDCTLRLWKLNVDEDTNYPAKISAFKILRGHKRSVNCVAAQTSGEMVCSGSWDTTIKLWKSDDVRTEDDEVTKKRKVGGKAEESLIEGKAFITLVGHTDHVSSVCWPQRELIYSASGDHSVRKWDVETEKNLLDISTELPLKCLDVGGVASALIATGGWDPVIRIWDPRKPGTSAPVFQAASHTCWISACKWHENSSFHLLSASYDGKLVLWDVRTTRPVYVTKPHDKVMCADWWKGDNIISGGADSKLCISSQIPKSVSRLKRKL